MKSEDNDPVCDFLSDMTLRWSCRRGDYVLWFTWTNIFADPQHGIRIKDLWEMKDGDFLTITNRLGDMPGWFTFHPTEVCDSLAYKMLERFNKGDYPEEPVEGPNIWRPKTGDHLVWLGKTRSGVTTKGPIISAVAFRESALVIGENARTQSMDELIAFGSLTKDKQTEEETTMTRQAVELVRQMGVPREYAPDWKIG
jgi:hypothetical protein